MFFIVQQVRLFGSIKANIIECLFSNIAALALFI